MGDHVKQNNIYTWLWQIGLILYLPIILAYTVVSPFLGTSRYEPYLFFALSLAYILPLYWLRYLSERVES